MASETPTPDAAARHTADRPYWYDGGVVYTQGPLRPIVVATVGNEKSCVINDDSMGERIVAMLNALAGIDDPAQHLAAQSSRIAALEGALKIIRHEHESDDGHFCRLCGAAGGRWPCSTRLEAVAALASPARAEGKP